MFDCRAYRHLDFYRAHWACWENDGSQNILAIKRYRMAYETSNFALIIHKELIRSWIIFFGMLRLFFLKKAVFCLRQNTSVYENSLRHVYDTMPHNINFNQQSFNLDSLTVQFTFSLHFNLITVDNPKYFKSFIA